MLCASLAACAPRHRSAVSAPLTPQTTRPKTVSSTGTLPAFVTSADTQVTIVNALSGLVLDMPNGSTANYVQLQQFNCNTYTWQNWRLVPAANGLYTIYNAATGKVLDDTGFSMSAGAPVQQYDSTGQPNQQWAINQNSDGTYTFVNAYSGDALDVPSGSLANMTVIDQAVPNGSPQQNWSIVPAGSCTNRGFSVLVDTNGINNDEASNDGQLAMDGAWAEVSTSTAVSPPITDPYGTWPGTLARLNDAHLLISEDTYQNYTNFYWLHDYTGLWANADMVYIEGSNTVLTTAQIDDAYAHTANPVIVLDRTYNDNLQAPSVRDAIKDPHCVGVAFEQNPGNISGWNFLQAMQDVLSAGRRVYFLLPPPDPNNGHDYAADIQSAVLQYLATSPQISNPNVYIVLAAYDRNNTQVGFLQPPPGSSSGNSIAAAESWLRSYRMAHFGR